MSVGRTDLSVALFNNFRNAWSGGGLSITGASAKAYYGLIESRHREQVEAALAPLGKVQWQHKPDAKESVTTVLRHESPADPATWPELDSWMAKLLVTLHDLFRPIVKSLNAADWQAPVTASIGREKPLSRRVETSFRSVT